MQQNARQQGDVIWEVDRRPVSMVVGKGAKAYTPEMILWVDTSSGAFLATDVVKPDAPESVVLDSFERALTKPLVDDEPLSPKPGPPAVVRVCRPAMAEALRPLAQARNPGRGRRLCFWFLTCSLRRWIPNRARQATRAILRRRIPSRSLLISRGRGRVLPDEA